MNENWPTGGWGVIEYGTKDTSNSQVVGGRWKPLMHLLASSLFCDVFLACGKDNRCYIRNDGSGIVNAVISMEAWALREEEPTEIFTYSISLKAGGICEKIRYLFLSLSVPSNETFSCSMIFFSLVPTS